MASRHWVKNYIRLRYPTKKQVEELMKQVGVTDIAWLNLSNGAVGYREPNRTEQRLVERITELEQYLNVEWSDGHYHKKGDN